MTLRPLARTEAAEEAADEIQSRRTGFAESTTLEAVVVVERS